MREFVTQDATFVTFLLTLGIKPANQKGIGSTIYFTYIQTPEFDRINSDFYRQKCLVEPIQFQNAFRQVRDMIKVAREVK